MSPQSYDGVDLQEVWARILAARSLTQSVEVALAAAATTASATYAKLLEQSITMLAGESLLIDFTAGASNNSGLAADWLYFDVTINGTIWRSLGTVMPLANAPINLGLTGRVTIGASGLLAGANIVQVRWRRGQGLNTSKIDPAVEGHHAVLRLCRVQA